MTEVDVHFYDSRRHQFQHLDSCSMPDEDEVRNIAGPLMTVQDNDDEDFISTENTGIIRRQDRGLLINGFFYDVAPELSAVKNNNFCAEDGLKNEKYSDGSSRSKEAKPRQQVVSVQSKDVPVSYQVHGLQPHEMPVIGIHVDSRIMPGFNYRVRIISSNNSTPATPCYQFSGHALNLLRIGQGYGKRLTFTPNSLNENTNYFWSDSNPAGYGFSILAVQTGDEMVLTDLSRRPIGSGTVEEASPCQVELGTELVNDEENARKTLVKRISVIMKVRLRYTCERHGMRSIRADETVIIRGVAKVVKPAGESMAHTKCIEEIELPSLGECLLYMV